MAIQTTNIRPKTGSGILRTSILTTAVLAIAVVLFSDHVTPRFIFYATAEVAVFTTIITFLAYGTFNRIWTVVCEREGKIQWTVLCSS
jgi:hypothetical protein